MRSRTTCASSKNRLSTGSACLALLLLALFGVSMARAENAQVIEVQDLLSDMEQAWSAINDYSKLVDKTERLVNGDVTEQTVFIKFRQPGHYYMTVLEGPNKNGELIYPAREGSDLAVAHAGGFKGGLARFLQATVILRKMVPTEFRLDDPQLGEWQHQTATDTSIGATIDRIAGNVRRALEFGEGEISLDEDCDEADNCLLRLDFSLPVGVGQEHEVRDGENLWSIAAAYGRPMYVIWYSNPEVRHPRKIKDGQTLFIPRYYAARGTVWVSPESLLPTRIEIFDADGELYERYFYRDVRLNIGLTDLDFDPENPDYRF
jgi:outer membrane lipoprotein-sorting protein